MPTRRAPAPEHRGESRLPVDRDDPPPPVAPARDRRTAWPSGTTIRVPDDAYRFGEGPLTLRIVEVLSAGLFEGRLWAEVRGHQVNADGTLRSRERFASIRVDRARVVTLDTSQVGAATQVGSADQAGSAGSVEPAAQGGSAGRVGPAGPVATR
ncbi:hypothetical protein ACGFIG_00175 [Micromonospora sp. NPDC049048]|uniref:hypothetical protein n=1 Tax=Micromonospora sp. NPDC049048 TaxID=3364263 RepID=UPI003710D0C7